VSRTLPPSGPSSVPPTLPPPLPPITPAVVTQRGARRLPRLPLLLLCAAYLLPGLFGRDPWRNADVAAFGVMAAMAEGRTPWLAPLLGGVPLEGALLPHWLGAVFIMAGQGWLDASLAARLPFALLLALTLALTWYSTLLLARTEAAQPVAFAFGGEADPVAYARAMADGGLLALMATLGLLQLGHETTPELVQLAAASLALYGIAAAPYRVWRARLAILAALPLLAASGAPAMAVAVGLGGALVCLRSRLPEVRRFAPWLVAALLLSAALASALGWWRWRVSSEVLADVPGLARQWLWFLWPAWPLALWTLWRWRRQLLYRHVSVPLVFVLAALGANVTMGGSDRALLLGLPALAVMAAFALPTLKRSATAAIDWFSMFFFTAAALTIWVVYVAMQTGVPAKTAANVERQVPAFDSPFSWLALGVAVAGTVAWMAVVRWRTGRHQEALWKSLVLPAGGVALCWLLLMTLWLPALDHARSARPLVQSLAVHVPAGTRCIAAPGVSAAQVAALEHFGRWTIDATPAALQGPCPLWLRLARERNLPPLPTGWLEVAVVPRPTSRDELAQLLRRAP
jgi:4-amino-4-deoxy-L-arabinose transferase-like glycosyltransferase